MDNELSNETIAGKSGSRKKVDWSCVPENTRIINENIKKLGNCVSIKSNYTFLILFSFSVLQLCLLIRVFVDCTYCRSIVKITYNIV